MEGVDGEVIVVTGAGQGHLHPCIELCTRLSIRNFHTTLIIPTISSVTPTPLPQFFIRNPLTSSLYITSGPPMAPEHDLTRKQAAEELYAHISTHNRSNSQPPIVCAIVDFQIGWTKEVFDKYDIPVVSFVSFGACAAAMELGAWRAAAGRFEPGEEKRVIEGLPVEMAVTPGDLKRKVIGPTPGPANGPPGGGSGKSGGGPPKPGERPPWLPMIEGSFGIMFNTCEELERVFLEYMATQMGMSTWGVGPLLPEQYWESANDNSIIRGRQQQRQSNYTEDQIMQWLGTKGQDEVLYVAFGSEVGPTMEEYPQIAGALGRSSIPFIWVITPGAGLPKRSGNQEGYYPQDLATKLGTRGLIITGWAPQLLILSHSSTGGFLSHCGWNSTVEAIGRGVPFLAWPIRGDQHWNAKFVVNYLKIGYKVADDLKATVMEEDIRKGIEKVMGDGEMRERAEDWRKKFEGGFPESSESSLNGFAEFVRRRSGLN